MSGERNESKKSIEHRAMPLEVGGALRFRLEAQDRGRRSEVRDQSPSLKLRRAKEDRKVY